MKKFLIVVFFLLINSIFCYADCSLTETNCLDGIDNDCNGASDYDTSTPDELPGDASCPVRVTGITIADPEPVENTEIVVKCTSSVPGVNSVIATLAGVSCDYDKWEDSDAYFDCPVGAYTLDAKTVVCSVEASKSEQEGSDMMGSVVVQASECSSYPESESCGTDENCVWCPKCSGAKMNQVGEDVCAETCTYNCEKDECGATCDPDNGGWPIYYCDHYCIDDYTLGIRDDVENGCSDSCTPVTYSCSIMQVTEQSCLTTPCNEEKFLTGSCQNTCVPAGTRTDGEDATCGTCTPVCSCMDGHYDLNNDRHLSDGNGCEYPCTITNFGLEICDGLDNNCDGTVDEDVKNTYYLDTDNDGVGVSTATVEACSLPEGYAVLVGDCAPDDPNNYPENTEVCDQQDNDCDDIIDENVKTTYYRDSDSDGYGDSGETTDACTAPSGYVENALDCDDTDAAVNPEATETCDGIDNNCKDGIDEGVKTTYYRDSDGDGKGSQSVTVDACNLQSGYVENALDCDDADADNFFGNTEACDGKDNDCDDIVDEDVKTTYYRDSDKDGYGNPAQTTDACSPPDGYVLDNQDCDDGDNTIKPGVTETCDSVDDDCDGVKNNGLIGTGPSNGENLPGVCANSKQSCDPDHTDWFIDFSYISGYETIETSCNDGIDNDCDGESDYDYHDNIHGDDNCPVSISDMSVEKSNPIELTTIYVYCEPDHQADSVFAYLDSILCQFETWVGNEAQFTCPVGEYTGEPKEAVCNITTDRSYMAGESVTRTITVRPTLCSDYDETKQAVCSADERCDWCPQCQNKKSNQQNIPMCVAKDTCVYTCNTGHGCGAVCDSHGGDVDYTCDYYCDATDNILYTRSDIDNQCDLTTCTPSTLTCDDAAVTPVDCLSQTCDPEKNLTGSCENLCISAGTLDDGNDASCGSCNLVCSCMTNYVDMNNNLADGCECYYTNGGVETCDGIDNDCNGLVDDGWETYPEREDHKNLLQDGVCAGSLMKCEDGQWKEYIGSHIPHYESTEVTCDEYDNDCDGTLNNGLVHEGPLNENQNGVCSASKKSCDAGHTAWFNDYSGIVDYEGDTEQTCDGKDNDCDCTGNTNTDAIICGSGDDNVDEGWETYPERQDHKNIEQDGVCDGSLMKCEDGQWKEYIGSHIPHYESTEVTCDEYDNDCNGQKNDGWEDYEERDNHPNLEQRGVCAGSLQQCSSGGWIEWLSSVNVPGYEPTETTCDNKNNDCDGATEEGCDDDSDGYCDDINMHIAGSPSICPNGNTDCDDTDSYINPGAVEKCNNIDDDCDGVPDNGCDDDGDGYCDAGLVLAAGGALICPNGGGDCNDLNAFSYPGAVERCDDDDNDCNGQTDEGCDDDDDDYCDSAMITHGAPAACIYGGGDCRDTDVNFNPGVIEKCDDIDTDCDGNLDNGCDDDNDGWCDENHVIVGSPLICVNGIDDCDDSRNYVYPGAEEKCDGVDNDCNCPGDTNGDGRVCRWGTNGADFGVDENIPTRLTNNQCGLCEGNYLYCNQGRMRPHPTNYIPVYEVCDYLDNDCDCEKDILHGPCGKCGHHDKECEYINGVYTWADEFGPCLDERDCYPTQTRTMEEARCFGNEVWTRVDFCTSNCRWSEDGQDNDLLLKNCDVMPCPLDQCVDGVYIDYIDTCAGSCAFGDCICECTYTESTRDVDNDGITDECDSESDEASCTDGLDNDGDGATDYVDEGCKDYCQECSQCGFGFLGLQFGCTESECSTCGVCYYGSGTCCRDSDQDTVCDSDDICAGYDDLANMDGDSYPDGCDQYPEDYDNDASPDAVDCWDDDASMKEGSSCGLKDCGEDRCDFRDTEIVYYNYSDCTKRCVADVCDCTCAQPIIEDLDSDFDTVADACDYDRLDPCSAEAPNDNVGAGLCNIDNDGDGKYVDFTGTYGDDICADGGNCDEDSDNDGCQDGTTCDNDGICDSLEPDTDGDEVIDDCDSFPNDPCSVEQQMDHCGELSCSGTDTDSDGYIDRCDGFINDPCSIDQFLDNCNGIGCNIGSEAFCSRHCAGNDADNDGIVDECDTEEDEASCSDSKDNDGDGKIDQYDGGCTGFCGSCDTCGPFCNSERCGECGTNCLFINGVILNTCCLNIDGDSVCDDVDNCPLISNSDQLDTDNDGKGDLCEDLDNDGMEDDWERRYNVSDPTADEDNDGLVNLGEYTNKTHPRKPDTDNDGILDKVEVDLGLDPLDPTSSTNDFDADGIPDEWETKYGITNALGDEDNDGVTNLGEYNNHTNPKVNDTDGDGVPDIDEIIAGTNPVSVYNDADESYELCNARMGSGTCSNGKTYCWDSTTEACCGDDNKETWLYETETYIEELYIAGVCYSGKWYDLTGGVTYYEIST